MREPNAEQLGKSLASGSLPVSMAPHNQLHPDNDVLVPTANNSAPVAARLGGRVKQTLHAM